MLHNFKTKLKNLLQLDVIIKPFPFTFLATLASDDYLLIRLFLHLPELLLLLYLFSIKTPNTNFHNLSLFFCFFPPTESFRIWFSFALFGSFVSLVFLFIPFCLLYLLQAAIESKYSLPKTNILLEKSSPEENPFCATLSIKRLARNLPLHIFYPIGVLSVSWSLHLHLFSFFLLFCRRSLESARNIYSLNRRQFVCWILTFNTFALWRRAGLKCAPDTTNRHVLRAHHLQEWLYFCDSFVLCNFNLIVKICMISFGVFVVTRL